MAADVAAAAAAAEDAAAPSVAVDDAAAIAKSPVGVAERVASVRPSDRPTVGGVRKAEGLRQSRARDDRDRGRPKCSRRGYATRAEDRWRGGSRVLAPCPLTGLGAATCKNI